MDSTADPVKKITEYEPEFFKDEDREKDEDKYNGFGKSFLEIFEEEEARKNKEKDLIGAKDSKKLAEAEKKKAEQARAYKEADLPGYDPEEREYEFTDYYTQKQRLSDSMALRMGVKQEKLDELKAIAETKDNKNIFTTSFNSGIANASAAITGGLDILFGKPLQALGWKNNPISTINDYYQKRNEEKYAEMMKEVEKTGYGKPMEYAAKFGSGLVSSIPNVLIAYMSGGTSAIAQGGTVTSVLKNPAFWYSFETSLYPEYERALMNGATENEATLVAPIASLFDAGIEVGGGIEKLPKAMQNQNMRNKILKNWVKVAVEEGNESVLQNMSSELTQKVIFDHKKDWVSFDKDNNAVLNVPKSFENWMNSAAMGGVLGAPVSAKTAFSKNAADFAEYESFKKIIGDDFTYDLDSFKKMKYNEPEKWEYNSNLKKYLMKYPDSNKKYYDVFLTLKNERIKEGVLIPPKYKQAFLLPEGKHDPYHVFYRMQERNITDDDLRLLMKDAKVMFLQWSGKRQLFVGDKGACVIVKDGNNWVYKTAWLKNDNDERFDKILEVIKNAGL